MGQGFAVLGAMALALHGARDSRCLGEWHWHCMGPGIRGAWGNGIGTAWGQGFAVLGAKALALQGARLCGGKGGNGRAHASTGAYGASFLLADGKWGQHAKFGERKMFRRKRKTGYEGQLTVFGQNNSDRIQTAGQGERLLGYNSDQC